MLLAVLLLSGPPAARAQAGDEALLASPRVAVSPDPSAADTSVRKPPAAITLRGGADPRIQRGIDLAYNLYFDRAEAYFDSLTAAEPDNPTGYFFNAMVAWWRVLIDLEDTAHDEAFYERLQRCIDVCDRRLAQDPDDFDAILYKGGAIGFRGRLRGDRNQFVRSARDGLRCLPLLEKSRQMEPTNKDILFGQGIYNYFAEVIPQRHAIVRPVMVFLPDGDRELGLEQLQAVAREGRYARAEAKYFLAQIYRIFEEDDAAALPYLVELHEQYPRNALFHRYRARTLIDVGRWAEGVALYRDVVARSEAGQAGYHTRGHIEALYYIGKDAFRRRQREAALAAFATADSLSRSLGDDDEAQAARGYTSLVNLYWGMALDELGRHDEAVVRFERVLDLPKQGRSHDLAKRYKKDPYAR